MNFTLANQMCLIRNIKRLNKIEMYIKYAYSNSNFDLGINERLIINLSNGILFISDNEHISYNFDRRNPCIIPLIKFLLDRGFCHGTYISLHGFKYMYRLLEALDELNCIG